MRRLQRHQLRVDPVAEWGYDRVTLEPLGDESAGDPVRVFLGSEAAQWRAERVFIWALARHADPTRRYEIHRLKDLAGFDRSAWTTGFTNFRFGIPEFCRGRGRAVYNDTDQIYLCDPGEIFDLPLSGDAFVARSDVETSVMLIDCEAMRPLWNLEQARTHSKKALHALAARAPGLRRGDLAPRYNARDLEHDPAHPGVLHFTTLHTQPWRPFPDHFFYEPHPLGELFSNLEREADRADFQLYRRDTPSGAFAQALTEAASEETLQSGESEEFLDRAAAMGLSSSAIFGDRELRDALRARASHASPSLARTYPALACSADWERLPDEDHHWILDDLFELTPSFLSLTYRDDPKQPTASYTFEQKVQQAARKHPRVTWRLCVDGGAHARTRSGGAAPSSHRGDPPRVWVLADERAGNTTQSIGVAETLAWPYEVKTLRFSPWARLHNRLLGASAIGLTGATRAQLAPPWPDLVLAAGGRSAPAARAIARMSGGMSRLVQLGRKGAARAGDFDLAVTLRASRLWPDPRRLEIRLPACRNAAVAPNVDAELANLGTSPSPRIALLVGGSTGRLRFSVDDALHLGRDVKQLADACKASLFVATSRRTGVTATDALRSALPNARLFYAFRDDDPRNPYRALLAACDVLIVTGDSESMLAEAAATEGALVIAPLPARGRPSLRDRLGEAIVRRARTRPENERGTARPQSGTPRLCARLVAGGVVRPLRDLDALHRDLIECGRAHALGSVLLDPTPLWRPQKALRSAEEIAGRIRSLFEAGEESI